jgi:hypothetical protein
MQVKYINLVIYFNCNWIPEETATTLDAEARRSTDIVTGREGGGKATMVITYWGSNPEQVADSILHWEESHLPISTTRARLL